jgi:hypothetical protein
MWVARAGTGAYTGASDVRATDVGACSITEHASCSCRERCQLHRVTEIMGRPPLYYELTCAMSSCMVFQYPVRGIPHALETPPSHNLICRQQLHLL